MAQIDLKNATIEIVDGTGTPNTLEINVGEGTLSFTETVNREYKKNRGLLDTVRNGDEEPLEVSFELVWEYYTGDDPAGDDPVTPVDALKKTGGASTWLTTSDDGCEPYCVDLVITYTPTCSGSGVTDEIETITFPEFRYETLNADLSAGTISVSGKCNVTAPTVARSTT